MQKKFIVLFVMLLFVAFSGCASVPQDYPQLTGRVDSLEQKVQKLEEGQGQIKEIVISQLETKKDTTDISSSAISAEIPVDPSTKDIQIALKNAGLYDGEVDGKTGPKTRNSIMEFQKQNNLKVDGVVGKNTWETLGKFYTK